MINEVAQWTWWPLDVTECAEFVSVCHSRDDLVRGEDGWRLQHCTGVSNIWINYSIHTIFREGITSMNRHFNKVLSKNDNSCALRSSLTGFNDLCWPNCSWWRFSSSMRLLRILWSHHSICQNLRTSIDRNASSALYPQEVQVSAEARHWLGGGLGAGAKHLLDVIASSSIH